MNYKRNRKSVAIIPAVLSGLTSVGLLYPANVTPIKYAEGYGTDMEMIGQDMWQAEENYRYDAQKEDTA